MQKLTGPQLSPRNGKAGSLVIILHGYGDSGQGILGLGHEWAAEMPDTAFVAPNAISVCEEWAAGYQWFSLRARDNALNPEMFNRADVIGPAHAALDQFIDEQLAYWGLDESRLAVAGFSQGAMMAMYTMPRRKKACAAIIGYSGMIVDSEGLKAPGIVKPPVLAIHGAADEVVPPQCLAGVEQAFDAAGFDVETVMRNGLAHSIDAFGLNRGMQFMLENFEKSQK